MGSKKDSSKLKIKTRLRISTGFSVFHTSRGSSAINDLHKFHIKYEILAGKGVIGINFN